LVLDIIDDMVGYVYLHRKKTDSTIFYVGLGGFAKSEKPKSFARAYKLTQRNSHHSNIVQKYGCKVEIYRENLTLEEAKLLESQLIKDHNLYKKGANNTLGGDGTHGYVHKLSSKKLVSESTNLRFSDPEWKSNWLKSLQKKDYCKITDKILNTHGVKEFSVYKAIRITDHQKGSGTKNYNRGKFIGTWKNKTQCCRDLEIPHSANKIRGCLNGSRKTVYGYIFTHEVEYE
jgi:hypothetical protein